ncbi:MAG: L-fucose mutarotase [Gammaproteobacteria bacterium]|nr:L-fucose mutarotase [Gammaproteobacteria bacterium]
MLRGISKYFSPELLAAIYKMGHGDEIVLADAFFPGHSINTNVIRADGVNIEDLLSAILPLFPLDTFVDDKIVMMSAVKGDSFDIEIEKNYLKIIDQYFKNAKITKIDRFDFYARAKNAFAVVVTGSDKKYANIILKKGIK